MKNWILMILTVCMADSSGVAIGGEMTSVGDLSCGGVLKQDCTPQEDGGKSCYEYYEGVWTGTLSIDKNPDSSVQSIVVCKTDARSEYQFTRYDAQGAKDPWPCGYAQQCQGQQQIAFVPKPQCVSIYPTYRMTETRAKLEAMSFARDAYRCDAQAGLRIYSGQLQQKQQLP